MTTIKSTLSFEEMNALRVLRKAIVRKPELAATLIEGISKECAYNIMKQAQKELAQLYAVVQAVTSMAGDIVKLDKEGGECPEQQ